MRILRVFHASRIRAHRGRDRALADLGHEVISVMPDAWPDSGSEPVLGDEPFRMVELPVRRPGDVNRHTYADDAGLARLVREARPDVVDLHLEPVSLAARQWLAAVPRTVPVTMYTAQNVDKRYPPPYAQHEARALRRVQGMWPCSRQAASVARGKGFDGPTEVLPLGYDPEAFRLGQQSLTDDELVLGLVGRMEAYKGVQDAVRVLASVHRSRPARLLLVGSGPELVPAHALAAEHGVEDRVEVVPWTDTDALAALYRRMHVVLVPSTATTRWVEQFGRVIVEAQASGAVVAGYHSGSIPEVTGGAGVLAAEGDVTGLTHAVGRLLDDPDRWLRLREAGATLCRQRTWPEVASRQAQLYDLVRRGAGELHPTGRAAARAEFGSPAVVGPQTRPFAVPALRDSPTIGRNLGRAFDRVTGA